MATLPFYYISCPFRVVVIIMSSKYFRRQVARLLSHYSPEEFVGLSEVQRHQILRRSQYRQHHAVHIVEGDDDLAEGSILREIDLVGENAVGEQICRDACEIYYGDNTFQVDSHWLIEFLGECDAA